MIAASEPPPPKPARGSSDGFGLLRAALAVALILGIPTFLILIWRGPLIAWQPATRLEVHGDSWDGNLATDGDRIYLMSREQISGFWGVLHVRSSSDGGRTWGEPVQVSAPGGPSAARHSLTVGPDGSLWAAWAQQGEAPSTQQLTLRRSRDNGRTWDPPIGLSGPEVGLVGIPVVVMTDQLSFAAYTNGETGIVFIRPLDPDGTPSSAPFTLPKTTRELYDDAPFFDAGLGAASVGGRGIIVGHAGDRVWRATQAGPGWPWLDEPWFAGPAYGAPRLAAVDGQVTALASVITDDRIQFSTETSSDGGVGWEPGATWLDPYGGEAALAVAPGQTAVLWESCDRFCSAPVIRLGDAGAFDGRASRIAGVGGRPAGMLLTDDTMVVAWVEEGPDYEAEQRNLVVATGPRPFATTP